MALFLANYGLYKQQVLSLTLEHWLFSCVAQLTEPTAQKMPQQPKLMHEAAAFGFQLQSAFFQ